MNGLLRRLTRRRAATADETPPGPPAASEPVDATVVSHEEGPVLSEEERARVEEERAREEELRRRRRDLPAGLDAERLEQPLGEGARRGAIRRRVRFLQAAREVLLRDLGGFSYEVHRAAGASHGGHREIIERKAARLAAVDEELRAHEAVLGSGERAATVVRQPGIGGTCPACGELHGSDAGYCSYCGTPLTERARTVTHPAAAERPTPGVVGRIRGALNLGAHGERDAPAESPAPPDESAGTSRTAPGATPGRSTTNANGDAAARTPRPADSRSDPPTGELDEHVAAPSEPRQ